MQIIIGTSVLRQRDTDRYRNICLPTARNRSLSKHLVANSATQIAIEDFGRRQRDADHHRNIWSPTARRRSSLKHLVANSVTHIVIEDPLLP